MSTADAAPEPTTRRPVSARHAIKSEGGGDGTDLARTVEALLAVPVNRLTLPPALMRLYLETRWDVRRAMLVAWLVAVAAVNTLALVFEPFILGYAALPQVLAGRASISAMFLLFAFFVSRLRRTGFEGLYVVAACVFTLLICGHLGAGLGPGQFERLFAQAMFVCGTAIVVARVAWRDTVALVLVLLAVLPLLVVSASSEPPGEQAQAVAFYAAAVVGLALARRVQNRYLYRMFVMTLGEGARMREIEALNARLAELARTDPLTTVSNRRHFEEVFGALKAGSDAGKTVALLMIDIDRFKTLNDAFGHETGDDCLRTVAELIKRELRQNDFLARFGGEEFVALLPDVSLEEARAIAERIRAAVARRRLANPDGPGGLVTVSVGFALSPPETLSGVMAAADTALYQAKSMGRDRICLARDRAVAAAPG